jgi:hypothetical protein
LRKLGSERLLLYGDEMKTLDIPARLNFLVKKLVSVGKSLAHKNRRTAFQREIYQLEVYQSNVRALDRYQKTPLTGDLGSFEIFETPKRRHKRGAELAKWSELSRAPVAVHEIPGKDSGDMISGQNASMLARCLSERLRLAINQHKPESLQHQFLQRDEQKTKLIGDTYSTT